MPQSTIEFVLPDADGFTPIGMEEPYPHADLEGPCIGQCCFPEAYPEPDVWTCMGWRCFARLHQPGWCINCINTDNF